MNKIADNVLKLVGRTPMVRFNRVVENGMADVYGKLEYFNPTGSVKDRICVSMIEDAEGKGLLKNGAVVIEPTSGNTGIGLAMVCAVKAYRLVLTMPETMSVERKRILTAFGAEIVLTPGAEGMSGAVKKAKELVVATKNSFMPNQFENPANPEVHKLTTAKEIIEAMNGKLDAFVAGVGTGGTLTGVGDALRESGIDARIVAVEPENSPVLSGGKPGSHKIQGIGAGFIPKVLNRKLIDEVVRVSDADSFKMASRLCKEEGLFVGISAGAAAFAALKVARDLGKGKTVVVILPDTGERYLSVEQ